ncbi:MAG: AAC(3) family N-acetyltransferase [Clostridia bacterium]|nr:AAC(3) family N-acetyltransferase [Clostridia bacterium]
MFTKNEILKQLETFEVAKGTIVTMHTSLKAVGQVDGGAEALLDTLVEFFTQDGGLFTVPTHTWDGDVFDMNTSYSCVGTFPKIAAAHPKGVRTVHPTHSMVVFGEKSRVEEFVKDEGIVDSPTSPKGCYGKIYDADGYVLLVGVGHNKNTYIHCVEEMLEVPNRLTVNAVERTVIHKDGREEKRYIRWFDPSGIRDVSEFFGKLEPAFRHYGCIIDGYIGNAKAQLCNARKMKEVIEIIYKSNNFGELMADHFPIDEKLYK